MNKAYSNKALPAGTVLREWRLEEVLGVGGFGIVYKGRGIYFDELVAIKEYFPSAISERDEEDTVVPIDSDAEEVHALGLKKFVEEAKLLWNLSTPSRHPNIVSVRSLFEIHGTAYMVMDFEDGMSLSRLLKDGNRFNERSLWDIIRPIAEGLDRAHRVGVLHRDIKPPNILITSDGRPVLIDFGSARFDTAEATSTTVTFHTPPYAAIEQYVKTYAQGPWTDIYALGVVLYECVTGSKPPEVLERLHGGLGEPLAAGKWPGYSKTFLAAIDSAMTIKPTERPQSIGDWLTQFEELRIDREADEDEEKTRFYAHEVETPEIVPVAPPADGANIDEIASKVPERPSAAEFKRAGVDTAASKKQASVSDPRTKPDEKVPAAPAAAATPTTPKPVAQRSKKKASPALLGGLAAAVAVVAFGGWFALGGSHTSGPASNQTAGFSGPTALNGENAPLPSSGDANLSAQGPAAAAAEPTNAAAEVAAPVEAADRAPAKAKTSAAVVEPAAKAAKATAKKPPVKAAEAAKAGAATRAAAEPDVGISPAKMAQFNSIIAEGRGLAKQVRRAGNGPNADLAKNYDKYLVTLKDSMRGVTTDAGAAQLIRQASQTRAYLQFLARQSQ